jgi:hypothetical protein
MVMMLCTPPTLPYARPEAGQSSRSPGHHYGNHAGCGVDCDAQTAAADPWHSDGSYRFYIGN